jgi:hypothetical protein
MIIYHVGLSIILKYRLSPPKTNSQTKPTPLLVYLGGRGGLCGKRTGGKNIEIFYFF